jgi:hypothetical protein
VLHATHPRVGVATVAWGPPGKQDRLEIKGFSPKDSKAQMLLLILWGTEGPTWADFPH